MVQRKKLRKISDKWNNVCKINISQAVMIIKKGKMLIDINIKGYKQKDENSCD